MSLAAGSRIGILTSGGDAPGMNAALRAAARVSASLGFELVGFLEGYKGLLDGRTHPLDRRELDEAARRGGTILGSARSKIFPTPEGQARAREVILKERLSALIVIGGNGSLTGARALAGAKAQGGPLRIGTMPASIDNDLAGTSMAIGVDTAMNTIVEAIDRLADTASAHKRTFIVEVMGRDSGYLAMTSAVASGADSVLVPEMASSESELVAQVVSTMKRLYSEQDKRRVIVVKAEGVKVDAVRLKEAVDREIQSVLPDVDTRTTNLGHVVRGGAPSAFDRLLAQRLGNVCVRALADGQTDFMAGWYGPGALGTPSPVDPYVVVTPLAEVLFETERLMRGESDLAKWRRRTIADLQPILTK